MYSGGLFESSNGLYGVTWGGFGRTQVEEARILLGAGVRIIQYSEKKGLTTRRMYEEALEIKRLCERHEATFIVENRVDIALAVNADGVHLDLDQENLPVEVVKKIFPGKIVGVTVNSAERALEAEAAGADYLGVCALYPSPTEPECRVVGDEGLKEILSRASIPVFAAGGIRPEHVPKLKSYGVRGVVAISGILGEPDPLEAAKRYLREWAKTVTAHFEP